MYRLYTEGSQNSTVRRKESRETKRFSYSVGGVGKNRSFDHGWGGGSILRSGNILDFRVVGSCGRLKGV